MAKVVIGAAFGDEGKGATVHALSSPSSTVVRFNGGAQAGHTVIHNGFRRVFSHIGSGTLKGAATHLSRFFVCHPLVFLSEWYDLAAQGITPNITVSPHCSVTTIYDVVLNRIIERHRGDDRHGSVGIGFGETLERNQHLPYFATVVDLKRDMRDWLEAIRKEWVPRRCESLGIDLEKCPEWSTILQADVVVDRMLQDFKAFLERVKIAPDHEALTDLTNVIFEGAQGLLLDQNYGIFPYVTRSNTGLQNVRSLINGAPLDVYYVTRAYTTRHGVGPLPFELPHKPYEHICDETNVHNEHQGGLRFSYLNLDDVGRVVRLDCAKWLPANSKARSIVTCLDQLPQRCSVIRDGEVTNCHVTEIPQLVEKAFADERTTA